MNQQEPSAASARTVEETRAGARAAPSLLVYERVLPAFAVSVARIRGELRMVLERESESADRRGDAVLFVSEASTNVVVHAYVGTSPGPLYAAATLAGRDLIVSVCDCGRGMVPRSDSPGAGLGLRRWRDLRAWDVRQSDDVSGTRGERPDAP